MRALVAVTALLLLAFAAPAGAVHFYRNEGSGCSPAEGALGGTGPGIEGANVLLLHNTFLDLRTGSPVTVVSAGQTVTWSWASAHCHSAKSGTPATVDDTFYSGFHYPTATPEVGPLVLAGLFDYPVPDVSPALSYSVTFDEPGTFTYYCEHHAAIGMVGVVVVV